MLKNIFSNLILLSFVVLMHSACNPPGENTAVDTSVEELITIDHDKLIWRDSAYTRLNEFSDAILKEKKKAEANGKTFQLNIGHTEDVGPVMMVKLLDFARQHRIEAALVLAKKNTKVQ